MMYIDSLLIDIMHLVLLPESFFDLGHHEVTKEPNAHNPLANGSMMVQQRLQSTAGQWLVAE
jgi:hypothetical protein